MSIINNYQNLYKTVALFGREVNHKVDILVVSKNQDVSKMEELIKYNISLFGESKVQEALPKIEYLSNKYKNLEFHFIGKLQTNKIKKIVENFYLIHSVDREEVLKLINKYAFELDKKQNVLIQLNIACEKQKNGIAIEKLDNMLTIASNLKNVIVNGLMFMPPYEQDVDKNVKYFKIANQLFNKYKSDTFNTLSMGMSHDYTLAIKYGATLIRIGTYIFDKTA